MIPQSTSFADHPHVDNRATTASPKDVIDHLGEWTSTVMEETLGTWRGCLIEAVTATQT